MDTIYVVFVKTDNQGRVIDCDSSGFLKNAVGWTKIDSGSGDKYYLAQSNYFPKPIFTELEGIPRYKLIDGVPVERTAEEIAADIAALPQPTEPVTWTALAAAYSEGVNEA